MTTERILDKIYFIATHNKKSRKVRDEIFTVECALEKIRVSNWDLFDSLNEKLTNAVTCN